MRALVLTPDFPPAPGGIQHLVHRTVTNAPKLESLVVTMATPGAEQFDREDEVEVKRVPRVDSLPRPIFTMGLNAAAVRQAIRFRPDVAISAHTVTSPGASLIRRALRVPVVQYFHGKEIGVRPNLASYAARHADACIAVSSYTRGLIEEAGGAPEKIHLIHPGVDLPQRPSTGPRADRPTVLTIARMEDRYKGHDVMIRAMSLVAARVPGAQWVVIGDGPLRDGLEEQARTTGLTDAIRFLGAVDDAERDAWLDRSHVFSMPSRMPAGGYVGEGFGIVYLEANAHGCPAIAGGVGGAVDAVVDGRTGLLVDAENHIDVGNALVRLLQDDDLRRTMGRQGAERAEEFSWPRIAERVSALVDEVVAHGIRR